MGVALGSASNRAKLAGGADPLSRSIQLAVNPVATLVSRLANGSSDFVAGVVGAPRMRAELRAMRDEIAAARLYAEQTERYRSEIDALRKDLGMAPIGGKQRIPADVIGQFSNSITLNVGSADGVPLHAPVVTGSGLVGRVETLSSHTCEVALLSSPELRIGASVLRDPPQPGLLHGESPTNLILDLTNPDGPVQIGDTVVTSGFSEIIPRGIPIGRVNQVYPDIEYGARRASVFPSVFPGSLREVFVLR